MIIQDEKASGILRRDSESVNRDAGHKNVVNEYHRAYNIVNESTKEREKYNIVARRRLGMKIKDVANVSLRRDSESANKGARDKKRANSNGSANNVVSKSTKERKNNTTVSKRLTHKEKK